MGFMDEYNKLKKKRLGLTEDEDEKEVKLTQSEASSGSFMDEYNKLKSQREEEGKATLPLISPIGGYGIAPVPSASQANTHKSGSFGDDSTFDYSSVLSNKDFSEKSQAGLSKFYSIKNAEQEAKRDAESKKSFWQQLLEFSAESYSVQADNPAATAINVTAKHYREDTSYKEPSNDWTDEQKSIFGYLYATNQEKAWKYAESVNNSINRAKSDEQRKAVEEFTTQNFGTGLGGTVASLILAPTAWADYADNVIEYANRGTITEKGMLTPFDYTQAATGSIGKKLNEMGGTLPENIPIVGGKGFGDLYSLGYSAAQSVTYGAGGSNLALGIFFGQAGASGVDEKLDAGGTAGQALLYGTVAGAAEGLAEKVGIDNLFKNTTAKTLKGTLLNMLKQGSSEAIEESLTSVVNNVADSLIMGDKSKYSKAVSEYQAYMSEEEAKKQAFKDMLEEIAYDALGGMVTGSTNTAVVTGANNILGAKSTAELTESEQKVVDKVYEDRIAEESENGEVSKRRKSEIYEEVLRDMDKGYISTDTIEEVLAGDSYKAYQDNIANEKALRDEYESLIELKKNDLTVKQDKRIAELEKLLGDIDSGTTSADLRSKLDDEVYGLVNGSRLENSYIDRENQKKAFSDDATKYENKNAQKTIQNMIDRKVVNNSNRSRELSDTLTKISAEKDVVFDVTNNKLLDESGHKKTINGKKTFTANGTTTEFNLGTTRMDSNVKPVVKVGNTVVDNYTIDYKTGKIVFDSAPQKGKISVEYGYYGIIDGWITKGEDGKKVITVNIDSPKMWQSVVGHEVTHSLEGTKKYGKLREVLYQYARDKGEYDDKLESVKSRYGEDTDYDSELTADLIGEYLFQDENFVKHLSTNNRNVFQWLWDEVKHLSKMVTAGSKEARQLEKVKHAFENAYREGGKATITDMKYALTEYGFEELTKETRNNLKMQGVEVIDARENLVGRIESALNGKEKQKQFTLGAVGNDAKSKIETDTKQKLFKNRQYSFIVDSDDFIHISKHFETSEEIADEVIRLFDIVSHYDSVEFKMAGDQKKLIFEKSYPHAEIRSVEVVSNNRNSLNLVTVFYTKKNGSQSVPTATSNVDGSPRWGSTSDDIVPQTEAEVNKKYSISDSDGNQLTDQQQEYFKDSKMRDDNGNLLKLYHGTPNSFTTFRQGTADGWGTGIYFTDNRAEAENYGENVVEAYLNITNPFNAETMSYYDIGAENTNAYKEYDNEHWQRVYPEYESYEDYKADGLGADMQDIYAEDVEVFNKILRELGYDGIIADGSNGVDGLEIVAFNENQAKLTTNQSPTGDPDIRFSISEPVEESKNLVALHNLTQDKLLKSLELGGLPMPSIAITKADIPHENFGDITLIFGKDTIDPKANKKNVVYSADAWTPTFPQVEYEEDRNVGSRINSKLTELESKIDDTFTHDIHRVKYNYEDILNRYGGEEGLIQYVMENYGIKAAYLEEKGHHIDKLTKQVKVDKGYSSANEAKLDAIASILGTNSAEEIGKMNLGEAKEKYGEQLESIYPGMTKSAIRMSGVFRQVMSYLNDKGGEPVYKTVTDEAATRQAVDDALNVAEFESWVRELFSGIEKDKGIYNQKDLFTPSGNRRSFKQTHLPFTLENIVKAMAAQNKGNTKNVSGFNGIKSLSAGTAERFKSIEAMRDRSGRLQHLKQEEVDKINDDLSSRLYKIIDTIDSENGNMGESNSFIRFDYIGETIMEISEGGKYNVSDIKQLFSRYGREISDSTAADIKQLLYDVSQMPVNIYEAKPERAVSFEEAGVFVIPYDADVKLKQELLNRGYSIAEYDPKVEGDRQRVVNQFEEYKFSLSDASDAPIKRGNFATPMSELRYEEAPTRETISEETISEMETEAEENILPDDIAPVSEEEISAFQRERLESLSESDAPPEVDAPYDEIAGTIPLPKNAVSWIAKNVKSALGLSNGHMADVRNLIQEYSTTEFPSREQLFDSIREKFGTYSWTEVSEEIKKVKSILRNTGIDVSEDIKNGISDYAELRRRNFGKVRFSKQGIPVDVAYKELMEISPHFFPDSIINPTDQLLQMVEVANLDASQEMAQDVDEDSIWEAVDSIVEGVRDYKQTVRERTSGYSRDSLNSLIRDADNLAPEIDDIAPEVEGAAQPVQDIAPTYEAIRPQPSKEPRMARATPTEQARAQVMVDEPKTEKAKSSAWQKFKTNFLDKFSVFEDLSLKTKNRELIGKANYMLSAESRAQRLIGNGSKYDRVKSLNSIIEEVGNTENTKQFYEYLYHKHNIDRMTLEERYKDTKNKPVFGDSVTAKESQEIVEQMEKSNPEFVEYSNDVYNYMNHLRNLLVENGVISLETANLWAEMYPHYVPIRRLGDTGLNINVPLDTGRTGVNAPIKRATGGSRDITPLFDTIAQRTIQTYKAIAKNNFGVELKNTLGTTIAKDGASVDDVIDNIDMQDGLLQEGKDGRNPTFTVFEGGEKVTFEITKDMYDALKPMSEGLAYTNKVVNKISNLHRGILTEYNPTFLLTNAIKDAQDVLINSQHAAKTYANFPKAIQEIVKKGEWYNEYLDNGGEQNTYFDKETNTFESAKSGIGKIIGMPLEGISNLNNAVEMLPRLAEYIASREAGRSVEVSMLDAARVTTNFAAGGDITKFLNRNGATFLNASVQGFNQQVRNIREAKANGIKGWVQLAAKAAGAGLSALLLNHLLWEDDEDYEELSDYVKQNYYVVAKFGDGQFVRIPKGRTLAVIQNAFEQISNAATGDDEIDLNSFLDLAVSNLAPNNPLENNIIAPIKQVVENKTWYGEDLVPTRLQDLPAAEQYDESTDSLSKWLGETLNYSPYKINYLLNQYSGGVGDVFLPMMTPEAERGDNSLVGNMIAPLKEKFTTDSVMNNQNVSDFYDMRDELTTNAKSSKATEEDVLKSKYFNSINSELGELYAKKREIQNSNLSDSEKYEQAREIQNQIIELTKESLASYDDIEYHSARDGEYSNIGNRYFKLDDDGEWQKLSDDQVTKYKVTSAAGDALYASDGKNHYRWYEPGEDSDGEAGWRKLTDEQIEKQKEVTRGLEISPEEYWSNKEEYDYAYKNPGNYAVAKAVGGYEAFRGYSSDLYDIKADKDENGKSISGSRKDKVIDYINSMDADYGEKIILFKSEYPADDTYNYEIIDYLNERDDISGEEMRTILLELGFEVSSDGTITW